MDKSEIKRIRGGLGLSQSGLARLLGISARTVQDYEQGRYKPGAAAERLLKLAEAGKLKPQK